MTLERHRSNLIPAVDFGGDGRIFVTDRHGSFPLRSGEKPGKSKSRDIDWEGGYRKREHNRYKEHDKEFVDGNFSKKDLETWESNRTSDNRFSGEVGSYHSYDPKRENRKYKPKEMSNYERAMREITGTGTVSSKSSNSLSRKVRRTKSNRTYMEGSEGRFAGSGGSVRSGSVGTASDGGRKFRRGGTPRMSPEMAAEEEFRRSSNRYRSLDVNALRKTQREMNNNNNYPPADYDPYNKINKLNGYGPYGADYNNYIPRLKKISEEKLPFVLFLTLGMLLLLLGVVRLLLSYWHEYFCLIWTGIGLTALGVVGAVHNGQYLNVGKSVGYILLAALNTGTTMASVALILPVLVPSLQNIVSGNDISLISDNVEFSNWNMTLVPSSSWLPVDVMVYLSVCLDVAGLLLVAGGFASLTVMLIALDYYWEASHDRTGECDHKGNPKFFNPLEQMSLAQATVFLGLLTINLQVPSSNTYFSPVIAPFLLLIGGFSAVWFGKRPDLHGVGFLSTMVELIAMLASGVATVLVTLGLVESITTLLSDVLLAEYEKSEVIASCIACGVFILMMVVNIVFAVGVVFRHVRQMCCAECFDDYLDQPYEKYGAPGSHGGPGSRRGSDYDVRL